MITRLGNQWILAEYLVEFRQHGELQEKYTSDKDWWITFAEKWEHTDIVAFKDVSYTEEEIARYQDVANMPEDFQQIYEAYIKTGETENQLPANHPFQMVVLKNKSTKLKTASEIYSEKKDVGLPLDELKKLRIEKLKEECSETIYQGFSSGVNEFGYNEKDQGNFTKRMVTVVAGSPGPFEWKSKNNGVVLLTKDEFLQTIRDAEAHQLLHQKRYWDLESQILSAETAAAVHAILW